MCEEEGGKRERERERNGGSGREREERLHASGAKKIPKLQHNVHVQCTCNMCVSVTKTQTFNSLVPGHSHFFNVTHLLRISYIEKLGVAWGRG